MPHVALTPRERTYVKKHTRQLDAYGAWWTITTGQRSKIGCADILACYKGYFIAIEVKATTPESPAQALQRQRVMRAGGYSVVAVQDVGVRDVELILHEIHRRWQRCP